MNGGETDGEMDLAEEAERAQLLAIAQNQARLPEEAPAPEAAPLPKDQPAAAAVVEEEEQKMIQLERAQNLARKLTLAGNALIAAGESQMVIGEGTKRTGRVVKIPANALVRFGAGLCTTLLGALVGVPLVIIGAVLWFLGRFLTVGGIILKGTGRAQKQTGEKMKQTAQTIRDTGGQVTPSIPTLPTINPLELLKEEVRQKVGAVRMVKIGFVFLAITLIGVFALAVAFAIYCEAGVIPRIQCGLAELAT